MFRTSWNNSPAARQALWDRFSEAPAPLGYKPSIVPGWDTSMAAGFGVLDPAVVDRLVEARPAAVGVELRLRVEQLGTAHDAVVRARLLGVPVLAGERPLGAGLLGHVELHRRELQLELLGGRDLAPG